MALSKKRELQSFNVNLSKICSAAPQNQTTSEHLFWTGPHLSPSQTPPTPGGSPPPPRTDLSRGSPPPQGQTPPTPEGSPPPPRTDLSRGSPPPQGQTSSRLSRAHHFLISHPPRAKPPMQWLLTQQLHLHKKQMVSQDLFLNFLIPEMPNWSS